jgi:hypothetical protein
VVFVSRQNKGGDHGNSRHQTIGESMDNRNSCICFRQDQVPVEIVGTKQSPSGELRCALFLRVHVRRGSRAPLNVHSQHIVSELEDRFWCTISKIRLPTVCVAGLHNTLPPLVITRKFETETFRHIFPTLSFLLSRQISSPRSSNFVINRDSVQFSLLAQHTHTEVGTHVPNGSSASFWWNNRLGEVFTDESAQKQSTQTMELGVLATCVILLLCGFQGIY